MLPDSWDHSQHPIALSAAEASQNINQACSKTAKDLERYVLPYDSSLSSVYFRFDVQSDLPFFEFEAKDRVLLTTRHYLESPGIATKAARVATLLEDTDYPSTPEDQVALAFLASLMTAFAANGHAKETETMSDIISSYSLYESASRDLGSHRKLVMACAASRLEFSFRRKQPWLQSKSISETNYPLNLALSSLMAFGEVDGSSSEHCLNNIQADLVTQADSVIGSYFLIISSRSKSTPIDSKVGASLLRQLSKRVSATVEVSPSLILELENFMRLSSLAMLCEAAFIEANTAEPRLLLSGPFIRHLTNVILQSDLTHADVQVLAPIANAISRILSLDKWSEIRDPVISRLLSKGFASGQHVWSLINLAVERRARGFDANDTSDEQSIVSLSQTCEKLLERYNEAFQVQKHPIAVLSIENGYLSLLRKLLDGDSLTAKVWMRGWLWSTLTLKLK